MSGVFGTREWSSHSVNCVTGCSHNCRYCYARAMAVRFGRCEPGEWQHPKVRRSEVAAPRRKLSGTVMFPTTHDITPEVLEPCLTVLSKLLQAGNDVLLVSKPHYECMEDVRRIASAHKDQILFRFTIGATDDQLLSYWEPGAPSFSERLACLKMLHEEGFDTSVSAEPCLDFANIDSLIDTCLPYVTDSIWIGKMNKVRRRVNIDTKEGDRAVIGIERSQRDEAVRQVYERYQDHPMIRWKDSVKQVVGLPLLQEAGLDI